MHVKQKTKMKRIEELQSLVGKLRGDLKQKDTEIELLKELHKSQLEKVEGYALFCIEYLKQWEYSDYSEGQEKIKLPTFEAYLKLQTQKENENTSGG